MNILKETGTSIGTDQIKAATVGEKIAWALLTAMVVWLLYNQ